MSYSVSPKCAEVTRVYLICGVIFAYILRCVFQFKCMVKLTNVFIWWPAEYKCERVLMCYQCVITFFPVAIVMIMTCGYESDIDFSC